VLQVVCPACGAKLNIRDDLKGKRINCGGCTNSFSIASLANQEVVPTQVVPTQTPATQTLRPQSRAGPVILTHSISKSYRSRLRRTSLLTKVISLTIQLGITCGTFYAGYYLLSQRAVVQKAPHVSKVEKPERVRLSAPKIAAQKVPRALLPQIVPRDLEPKLRVPQLPDLPSQIDLPEVDDTRISTLFENIQDAELELVSLSTNLKHDGKKLSWNCQKSGDKLAVIAGLTIKDEKVLFRWLGDVPKEAERDLRNSVIKIKCLGDERVIALRQPLFVEPSEISLKKNVQRIVAKFDHQPPRDAIRADFTGINLFPHHRIDGCSTNGMKLKDTTTIWYNDATAAASRLSLKKIGNTITFELDSRYKLPSGDEEPMSISRGNRNFKQLNRMMDSSNAAKVALAKLQRHLSRRNDDLNAQRRAESSRFVNDFSVGIGGKIQSIKNEILAIKRNISEAKRLVSQRSAIQRELVELDRVSQVAKGLHGKKGISYRIYMVVAGHEIDLLLTK